jgi:hypothetical protein
MYTYLYNDILAVVVERDIAKVREVGAAGQPTQALKPVLKYLLLSERIFLHSL